MKRGSHRSVAAAIAAIFAGPALGQSGPAPAEQLLPEVRATGARIAPGSRADSASTATKTDTPLKDVPASVVVVSGETLREQGVYDMNRAMYNVSSAQTLMGGGYGFADNYTLRGQSVLFLRDGYPDGTTQNGYRRSVADVERIEVLKGPGSALYGSGGAGGTINVITRPPLANPRVEFGATIGAFGTRIGTIDAGGPLGPVSTRLIGNVEEADGYRGLGRRVREILPTLAVGLGEDKRLVVDYDHREIRTTPDNYGIVFDFNRNIAAAPRAARYYSPMNRVDQEIDRVTLSHELALGGGQAMRTALIHDRRDIDFFRNAGGNGGNAAGAMTGRTLREQHDRARYTTLQNEWVLKSRLGGLSHTVLVGAQYDDTQIDTLRRGYNLPNIANVNDPVIPETTAAGLAPVAAQGFDRRISGTTLAGYVQDQVAFNEQWKARAGLRLDRTSFSDAGAQGATAFRELSATKSVASGSLGAVWQPGRDWSLFTGVSRGGFINLSTEPGAVSTTPERSSQLEAGAKATLFGGAADAQLALYEVTRRNYLITLPGALSATPDGDDRTRGIELDLTARLARAWKFIASAYVQDAEVRSDTVATNAVLGVSRNIAGTRPTGVARSGGKLWAHYQVYGTERDGLGAGLGINRKGDSFADSLNLYRVPAYTVLDAAVYYRQKAWDVGVSLYNLTDRVYYTNPTFSGALPGEPRSLFVTFRWRPA